MPDFQLLFLSVQATTCWFWFREARTARERVRELDAIAGQLECLRRMAEMTLEQKSKPEA